MDNNLTLTERQLAGLIGFFDTLEDHTARIESAAEAVTYYVVALNELTSKLPDIADRRRACRIAGGVFVATYALSQTARELDANYSAVIDTRFLAEHSLPWTEYPAES